MTPQELTLGTAEGQDFDGTLPPQITSLELFGTFPRQVLCAGCKSTGTYQ